MVKSIYRDRRYYFTDNGYNLMDLCMYSLFAVSFGLRYYTIFKVSPDNTSEKYPANLSASPHLINLPHLK